MKKITRITKLIRSHSTKYTKSLLILAMVIIFICFSIINNIIFSNAKFDLTGNNIYTLANGSKNIVKKIKEPVTIRFFYSKELIRDYPKIQTYSNRVLGLLKEYQNNNQDLITLKIINPEAFSKEEDEAVAFGIKPIPTNDQGEKLYFGIVLSNSIDEAKVIPFLDPARESFLEYDLSQMIYNLNNPQKPKLALLNFADFKSNNPYINQNNKTDWTILEKIKELYDVQVLDTNVSKIEDSTSLLLLIHPNNVSPDTEKAIENYVLNGGKAFIFLDPYVEISGITNSSSNLDALLSKLGVKFDSKKIVLDAENSLTVPSSQDNSTLGSYNKLNWLQLSKNYLNQKEIITSNIGLLNIISAGNFTLKKPKDSKLSYTTLFATSTEANKVDNSEILDGLALLKHFSSKNKSYRLSVAVSGSLKESNKKIHLVLVGDVDMLRDTFWLRKQEVYGQVIGTPIADNGSFVINTLDNLSGSDDLISLRSRGNSERPFDLVNKIKRAAESKFLNEEQNLNQKLKDTEAKLLSIQQNRKDDKSLTLNNEQEKEVEAFRKEILDTRAKLRDVRHNLDKDIDRLGSILKFIHIILIPAIIVILALFLPSKFGIKRNH